MVDAAFARGIVMGCVYYDDQKEDEVEKWAVDVRAVQDKTGHMLFLLPMLANVSRMLKIIHGYDVDRMVTFIHFCCKDLSNWFGTINKG